jgi:hypothetical protein
MYPMARGQMSAGEVLGAARAEGRWGDDRVIDEPLSPSFLAIDSSGLEALVPDSESFWGEATGDQEHEPLSAD